MKNLFNRFAATVACKAFAAKQQVQKAAGELKSDERGLSGVVVAILLILVAVLAVVMIWQFLGDYIGEIWTRITNTDDALA